jgi:hypothetical protein
MNDNRPLALCCMVIDDGATLAVYEPAIGFDVALNQSLVQTIDAFDYSLRRVIRVPTKGNSGASSTAMEL